MKNILFLFPLLLLGSGLFAQKKEADEKFRLYQYARAVPLYEKHLAKHPDDYDATTKLATAFKLTNNVPKAIEVYKAMIKLPESQPEDLFHLVQLLQVMQQQTEARQYALQYQQRAPGAKAATLMESLDHYAEYMSAVDDYRLTNKTAQYPFSVLTVYPLSGKLMVTAENKRNQSNKWTGRSFTDLYLTDASFAALDPFAPELMTEWDDGIPSFSPDGNTIYFTSVNPNTVNEGEVNSRKLHILTAVKVNGQWTGAQPFPFNADACNTAHPTLSKDGNLLVFSSDRAGGAGGMDLYYCRKQGVEWTAPQPIAALNTYGNELFPVFQPDNTLVFTTNGLPGLGGLDMYTTSWKGSGFSQPEHIKAPLNSSYDDYGLISEDNMQSGYLTSNRAGSTELDHVFYFSKQVKAAAPVAAASQPTGLRVKVVDKYTHTPLPYVAVAVKDKSGQVLHKGLTDEEGMVVIEELSRGSYSIQGLLNDVTTTIATVEEADFQGNPAMISRELQHNDPRFTLKGVVINKKTNKPVEGVTVTCTNRTLNGSKNVVTKADGTFFFQLEQKSDFTVFGQKEGWLTTETAEESTKGMDRTSELYVRLSLDMQQPASDDVIRLNKIYYDYDKCTIKPASAAELDRLITLLRDFPDMKIELSSHTDSRGSDAYNQTLSQCRADAAVSYLRGKGIAPNRLEAKGYGETRLVNPCANGVPCSEEQHQQNRRTEFRILSCQSCPRVEQ